MRSIMLPPLGEANWSQYRHGLGIVLQRRMQAHEKNSGQVPWAGGALHRGAAGYGNALLLLLLVSAVHRLHRRGHSQLDPRSLHRDAPGNGQSLWRNSRHDCGHPHVRRHLRHDSHRGGAAGQGHPAGRGAVVHNGRHDPFAAVHNHAAQGGKAEAAGDLRSHLYHGHHCHGLLLQCHSIFACVTAAEAGSCFGRGGGGSLTGLLTGVRQPRVGLHMRNMTRLTGWEDQRCTRPDALPAASAATSATETWLKSCSMECLRQEAATAKSMACCWE